MIPRIPVDYYVNELWRIHRCCRVSFDMYCIVVKGSSCLATCVERMFWTSVKLKTLSLLWFYCRCVPYAHAVVMKQSVSVFFTFLAHCTCKEKSIPLL